MMISREISWLFALRACFFPFFPLNLWICEFFIFFSLVRFGFVFVWMQFFFFFDAKFGCSSADLMLKQLLWYQMKKCHVACGIDSFPSFNFFSFRKYWLALAKLYTFGKNSRHMQTTILSSSIIYSITNKIVNLMIFIRS